MTIKHLFFAPFIFLMLSSFSNLENTAYFISVENLDSNNYREVKLASLQNEDFMIESACVPAGIIKMNYLGNSSNIVDEIKNFFNSSASINQIQILSNFTEENYFEKCSDARVGR